MEKTNDWLAALFLNPDKGVSNFIEAGFNDENTVMYNKDYYLSKPQIQDSFKDSEGNFDQKAFDNFYDSALRTYNGFIQESKVDKNLADNSFGFLDLDAKGQGKLPEFGIVEVSNPELKSQGISSLLGYGKATRSMREAAQTNYVRDSKGNILDYTPNDDDRRGFNFFSIKPLYYAKYTEDGYHLNAEGEEVFHTKGEYKLDDNGIPYLQELGYGEDVSGKDLLKLTDTLTVDGSAANKWDFLESDGIDKSVTKSVTKMVATIAPIFIPYVGEIYAWSLVTANLAPSLASIAKTGVELLDSESEKSKVWNLLNNIEGRFKSAQGGVSDAGSQSFFNVEQFSNLVSDIATQGMQQRAVAQGALKFMKLLGYDSSGMNIQRNLISKYGKSYLEKYGKSLEQALKDGDLAKDFRPFAGKYLKTFNKNRKLAESLARSSSSLYMALTQASDITDAMKENGFSSGYTAAATLAAVVGFKKIMDSELGEVALKGLGLDKLGKEVSKNINKLAGESKVAFDAAKTSTGKLAWIQSTSNKIYDNIKKVMNNSEFMDSALKEGAEEVSEELLQDTIMKGADTISWALKATGLDKSTSGSWSYLDSNPLERYLTAFIGGAVGGPVNRAVDIAKNWRAYKQYKQSEKDKQDTRDFIDLVREYGAEPVIKELEKRRKKHLFPTTLSMDSLDGLNFESTDNKSKSQNDLLFDYLEKYVYYWDRLIHEEKLNVSDEQLIDEATWKDARVEALKNFGLGAEVIKEYNDLLIKLANANLKYKEEYTDENKDNPNLVQYKKDADEARQKIQELRQGLYASDFLDRAIFKMNRALNASLYTPDINVYAKKILNINYSEASDDTKKEIEKSYAKFKENNKNVEDLAYEVFNKARELIQPNFKQFSEEEQKLDKYSEDLRNRLNDLYEKSSIEGLKEPSKEEVDNLLESIRQNKSDDTIIEERGLNPKGKALTEEQKHELVENSLMEDVNNMYTEAASVTFGKYYKLGLDSRFFGDVNRLTELVNILQEIGNTYGYLDSETLNKVQLILNDVDSNRFSLDNHINEYVNNFQTFSLDKIDYGSSEGPALHKITEKLEKETGEDFKNYTTITIRKNSDEKGIYYDVVFYNPEYGIKTKPIEITEEDLKTLLKDLSGADVNSLSSYASSNNTTVEQIRNVSKPNETILNLVNNTKKLLEFNSKDIISGFIQKLSSSLYGEDVFKLSGYLVKALATSGNLNDFIISDPYVENQVEVLLETINLLKSLIAYSSQTGMEDNLFDPITISNELRQKNGLEVLQELNFNNSQELLKQLNEIETSVSIINEISKTNNEGKIKENKIVHSKVTAGWVLMVLNNPKVQAIKINGESFFDNKDFDNSNLELLEKAYKGAELTENELLALEKISLEHERYYYNKFQKLSNEEKEEFIESLSELNPYGTLPVKINKEFDHNNVDNESLATYCLTTCTVNPDKFKANYAEAIKTPDFKDIVPFYSQMLAVKVALASYSGSEWINKYLIKVAEKYQKSKGKGDLVLLNQVIIPGTAGCGKTKVIAKLFTILLKSYDPNITISSYAWKQDRVDELSSVIGTKDKYHEFGIYKKWFSDEDIEEIKRIKDLMLLNDPQITYTEIENKCKELSQKAKAPKFPEIIVVDEYTHLSNFELKILGSIDNVHLLNLGDYIQNGFNGFLDAGGECTKFSSFYIDVSIRPNNNLKKENMTKLASVIDTIKRKSEAFKTGNGGVADVATIINLMKKDNFFKYYEKDGLVYGEKVVTNKPIVSDLQNMLDHLKEGENIGYIYDSANTPSSEISSFISKHNDKIILVKDDNVQGSEYSYTIVDVNYSSADTSDDPEHILKNLTSLNTWVTRSKEGSIIVQNKNLALGNSKRTANVSRDVFNPKEVEEYQKFVSVIYDNLELNEKPVKVIKTEETKPISEPELKTNTSGEKVIKEITKNLNEEKPGAFKIIQSHIMYNLNDGTNRNLGKWSDKKYILYFNLLKNLIFRNQQDLVDLLYSDDVYVQDQLRLVYQLFEGKTPDEIKQAITNSNFYIKKVKYSDAYKQVDNGVNSNTETPEYIYVFYRQIGDWEIDLGISADLDKFDNAEIKKLLTTADIYKPIKINRDKLNVQFNQIKITNLNSKTFDNNSIDKFREENPWAAVSDKVWLPNSDSESFNTQLGYPFVLYHRDLFVDPGRFLTIFKDRIDSNKPNGIVPLRASLHGYTFKEYVSRFKKLYTKKGKAKMLRFTSFSGFRQPFLIRRQLLIFKKYLEARKDGKDVLKELLETWEVDKIKKAEDRKKAENKFKYDVEHYNEIIKDDEVNALYETITTLFSEWDSSLATLTETFNINWSRVSSDSLSIKTKDFIKKYDSENVILDFFGKSEEEKLEKIKELEGDTISDKNIETIKSDMVKLKKLYDDFTGLAEDANFINAWTLIKGDTNFTNISPKMIDWLLKKDYIVKFAGFTMLMHKLVKIVSTSKDDSLIDLVSKAVDSTYQFKDGIWTNGAVTDGKINGFYLSGNTINELYFNSLIEMPDAYISLDSFETKEEENKPNGVKEENKVSEENDLNLIFNSLSLEDEDVKKVIEERVNNRVDKEETISSFLNGQYFIVNKNDADIIHITFKDDDGNWIATTLDSDSLTFIENLKAYKNNKNMDTNKSLLENIRRGSGAGITIENGNIKVSFTDGNFIIYPDKIITEVQESTQTTTTSSETQENQQTSSTNTSQSEKVTVDSVVSNILNSLEGNVKDKFKETFDKDKDIISDHLKNIVNNILIFYNSNKSISETEIKNIVKLEPDSKKYFPKRNFEVSVYTIILNSLGKLDNIERNVCNE